MINIVDKVKCAGCYACENCCPKNCISMQTDEEGFWYPVVDKSQCIHCGLCLKVCPLLQEEKKQQEPIVWASINKDAVTRKTSSSGGTFTLLAERIIAQRGTVFGAVFDEQFQVLHKSVDDIKGLEKLRGSKYVQSRIGSTYEEAEKLLKAGKTVLFSGTGCQIAGLKSFLRKDYCKLWTVDIVCHGVPSPKVYTQYLAELAEEAGQDVTLVNFRDKNTGWNGFKFVVETGSKKFAATKREDPYMRAFLNNLCTRPSCSACKFNAQRSVADITLADYWGVASALPAMDDNQGTSLVLVNTSKGQELFDEIREQMIIAKSNYEHAASHNHAMMKKNVPHKNRTKFFQLLGKEKLKDIVQELLE